MAVVAVTVRVVVVVGLVTRSALSVGNRVTLQGNVDCVWGPVMVADAEALVPAITELALLMAAGAAVRKGATAAHLGGPAAAAALRLRTAVNLLFTPLMATGIGAGGAGAKLSRAEINQKYLKVFVGR